MREIKPLTSFRALAAFLVFMYHYAYLYGPMVEEVTGKAEFIPLMPLWRVGQVGVSLFFVLSGFLITRIYYDTINARQVSLRLFFVKRIARIWPLFIVLTILQHAGMWLGGQEPASTWLVTMSMTQGFFETLRYKGLPTAWSLTIEETFYALAPPLYLVICRFGFGGRLGLPSWNWRQLIRFGTVLGGIVVLFGMSGYVWPVISRTLGLTYAGFMGSFDHAMRSTLCGRFLEFAVGIACAFVHRQGVLPAFLRGWRAPALAVVSFVGIGFFMYLKDLALGHGWVPVKLLTSYAIVGCTGLLILALSQERTWLNKLLSWRLLVYLGKISYCFYLMQSPVLMQPLHAVTDHLGVLRLPALCLLMNLVCAFFYKFVETPTRRAIVARWGQQRNPADSRS
ncbi:MAG: acyltransferase [bacterium]